MEQTLKTKLATNLGSLHKMASAWVMTAAGIAATVWLSLSDDQRAAIAAHLPGPPWLVPVVVTLVGLAARAWPQKSVTPAEAAAKSADAPVTPAQ